MAASVNVWRAVGVGLLALIIGMGSIAPGIEDHVRAAQPGQPITPCIGVVDAYERPDDARYLGVCWERITFEWAAFQPDGPDDFEIAVDPAWLGTAADAGREAVGLITHTPAWASESGEPGAVPDGLDLSIVAAENSWAAFITRLVEFYAPLGVHRWIIYDAPNVRVGEGPVRFAGEVDDYAQVLRVAYRAATAVDPGAVIHVAAAEWWVDVAAGRESYLARLLRALESDSEAADNGYYFGVVMVRVFNDTAAVGDALAAHRAILDGVELFDKAIWLETNASPTLDRQGGVRDPLFGITPEQQADFIVQAAALSLVAGVDHMAVFRLADVPHDDQPWGLMRVDGSRRPAFDATKTVIDLLARPLTVTRYEHPDGELIWLEGERQVVVILWARGTTPVRFAITTAAVGETATLYNAQGWFRTTQSEPFDWPAAFLVDVPAARRDANGFLTVAGSPSILVLNKAEDFFRVGYVQVNGEWSRIK